MPLALQRVTELHYIAHVDHIPSILKRGLLCRNKAKNYISVHIADADVQRLRAKTTVPKALPLHDYVNLYFDARNPMMYVRKERHLEIAVLRVSPDILSIPGVVIADGNAAHGNTGFHPSPDGLEFLDEESVFAQYWNDNDYFVRREKRRKRCAEVLVPGKIPRKHITGAYVSCVEVEQKLRQIAPDLTPTIRSYLFFR